MAIAKYISITILIVSGLNAPTKRQTRLMYLPLKRDSLQTSGHIQNENRGWKKISHANRSQKETGKVIFISN